MNLVLKEYCIKTLKPPPIDYTTIPGLKSPDLEETEAAITFPPGELIIERSSARGCLDQFQHLITEDFASSDDPILIKVLKYLNGNYGSISSLFIGPRYVVCLSGIKQTKQLRKYWGSNANICPWAFGSIILGDPYFWESKSIEEWENEIENNQTLKKFTSFNNQSRLLLDFPETGNETYELYENEHKYEIDDDEKSTVTSPILTLSFQHEIDIDGHLIPAFVSS
uniref:Uncharacterized protein n=1 Tax=Panagrolaimus sp. ES5 TaxID=591445 RepID=A0AC34GQP3_9BILA